MAKQRGKLKDIKIHEISLVDLPANKLPFLFFKREGAKESQFVKAKKKVTIAIESNGLVGGTKVSVNGEDLGKLRNFDFSFYGDDPKQSIHASYSKVTESEDGFNRTDTYYLSKGEIAMNKKTLKALQTYLGTEDIDFEKKVGEEDIEKALTLISEHYKESFPEDLENAVGVIAKCAANSYEMEKDDKDVKKAGAKFSKDVLKKLKAVLAAVEALKGILPDMKESTEKSDSSSEEIEELVKQMAEIKDAIEKLDSGKKKDDKSSVAELTKSLKEISDRLKTVEGDGATKKSITGDDNDDDNEQKGAGEDGKHLWPTITGQSKD